MHNNSVLFICTANLIRSPMGVALLKSHLEKSGLDISVWRIESAGTWAANGQPAMQEAQSAIMEHGLKIDDHRSRRVSGELLQQYNLILVMTSGHKEALKIEFPEISNNIYLLSEMAGAEISIDDPVGLRYNAFRVTAEELNYWITEGIDSILEKARGS